MRPTLEPVRAVYNHIAPYYDAFTAHHDYELWLGELLGAARPLGLRGRRLLDVACGTGKSFLPMVRRGWEVMGCDISEEMLARAAAKSPPEVRLEVADMRDLPKFGQFDLVWCLDDAVNYLADPAELRSCLAGLHRNVAPWGLVIFDVNTLLTYRTFFAGIEAHEHGDYRLIWRGHASASTAPGSRVAATFEVAPKPGSNGFTPSRAVHRQRHFRPEEVLEALDQAGLQCIGLFGHWLDARLERPLCEDRHTKAVFFARQAPGQGERR